jgi:hypothetical protein
MKLALGVNRMSSFSVSTIGYSEEFMHGLERA